MAIFGAGIDIGLAILLATVFIAYAKIKIERRALVLVTTGALLYLLGGALATANLGITMATGVLITIDVIGSIAVVIGFIWAAVDLVRTMKK